MTMLDWRDAVDLWIDSRAEWLSSVRRWLHVHPELSRDEFGTIRYLSDRLKEGGVDHKLVASGRGIVAGDPPGKRRPLAAIRADVDALPIADAKDVPYRSQVEGVMHACGHDAHATMALGAALALRAARDVLPRDLGWRAIFQPAEEIGEGAHEMVASGAMDGVAGIVALHVDPERTVGRIGYRRGALTAFCHDLHVVVQGIGGHAARPHLSRDPIAAAAQFVSAAYQLVARSVDARDPTVVTFGSIQGGSTCNVIPDQVTLRGTIRTLSRPASQKVAERLRQIANGVGEATETEFSLSLEHSTDGVYNDPRLTSLCVDAAGETVGLGNLDEIALPSMGGEDFSGYLGSAPGCMLRLGVGKAGTPGCHLHSPDFDIDEQALAIGAKLLARCVVLSSEAIARGDFTLSS